MSETGGLAPLPAFLAEAGEPPIPWEDWIEDFHWFLTARGGTEKWSVERKVALLRYSLGAEGRAQYRAIQDEEADGEDEFQKTIARLKRRFAMEKGLAAARLEFVKRKQMPGETLRDFAGALRKLGNRCKFPMSLDDAIVT